MKTSGPIVLILGSGPNAKRAAAWPKAWFNRIVVINNAWRVRADWDALVSPEDFAADRKPQTLLPGQMLVGAAQFVPAQNRYGGFVLAGATMAYTTAYWALAVLRPRVLAFMGCDMTYPLRGNTHFYGHGTADPLRDDVSLRNLSAKSARLAMIAAMQGCACVNLSDGPSALLFPRCAPDALDVLRPVLPDRVRHQNLLMQEAALQYDTPDGWHDPTGASMDIGMLDQLDAEWTVHFEHARQNSGTAAP